MTIYKCVFPLSLFYLVFLMKGLINLGNTCYFNASLQCLLQIPCISNHFSTNGYSGDCEFTNLYCDLVKKFWNKNSTANINVNTLLVAFQKQFPRFEGGNEEDSQEALLCIIDILERAVPEIKPYFYGKKTQETIWPGGKSSHDEDFSIHIMSSRGNNLKDMLRESSKWNTLTDFEDKEGKTHNVATTRSYLSKLPKILMISFDTKSHVYVDEELSINDNDYRLIASTVHMGNQHGGHYTSFTKHKGVWYYKDDDVISKRDFVKRAGHYILVYNLKTP